MKMQNNNNGCATALRFLHSRLGWKDCTQASVSFDHRQRCAMQRHGQNWLGFMKSATLLRWIASAFQYSSANGEGRHPELTPSARAVFRSTPRLAPIWKRSSPTSQSQASRELRQGAVG